MSSKITSHLSESVFASILVTASIVFILMVISAGLLW